LQHSRVLASGQFRQQDDLTVRQFKSIMVCVGPVLIDLAKPSHLVRQPFVTEAIGCLTFQILFKSKLGAQ
jgi:hypothetical protein